MKLIVTPDANGVVSANGRILGQTLHPDAVLIDVDGTALPPHTEACIQPDGSLELVANHIGSGPWFDQGASTANRETAIHITELGVVPASTWAMTPRAETPEEITTREAAAASAAATAEAARIANLEVARYAALLALLGAGITESMISDQIALISNAPARETKRLYFNRPAWRRNSDFIGWGKTAFGLSDAQVDALFLAADTLDN